MCLTRLKFIYIKKNLHWCFAEGSNRIWNKLKREERTACLNMRRKTKYFHRNRINLMLHYRQMNYLKLIFGTFLPAYHFNMSLFHFAFHRRKLCHMWFWKKFRYDRLSSQFYWMNFREEFFFRSYFFVFKSSSHSQLTKR